MRQSTLLRAALQQTPADALCRLALADALAEEGCAAAAGRQRLLAGRLARQAQARERPGEVTLTGSQAARIRALAGLARSRAEVSVTAGDPAPKSSGEAGYTQFKDGGLCRFPGAARRAGYRIEYVPSTLAISVGVEWLIREGYIR